MILGWLKSLVLGLVSGFFDLVPVSSQAHEALLVKFWGIPPLDPLQELLIHLGILGGLYISCRKQLLRISRARAMAHVPKKRRRRPLDTRSLMDGRFLNTMLLPVILALLFFRRTSSLEEKTLWLVGLLVINGFILFLPQFFPSGNRDSRTLTRVEGLLMGLGGALSVFPGISAVGSATSVASLCGIDRSYALDMAFMLDMALTVGWIVYDVLGLAAGVGALSFALVIRYIFTGLAAFGGSLLGARLMRYLAGERGYSVFAFYSWGLALFTFILNLMA